MMKNKILLLLLAGFMFPISSCDDRLELFPLDAIAVDEGFQNINDFNQSVKGIYSGFRRSGYYGADSADPSLYFLGDIISDNVILNQQGRRSRETFYDWRYDEDSSSEAFWLSAYKVIQRSNLILEKIEAIAGQDGEAYVRSQALAARAIAHFDLARVYANSPAQGSDGDLGIPYVTSTESSLEPTRNTLGETYTLLLADLNEAITLSEANNLLDNGRGFIGVNAMYAMLSRIHLFRGDFQASLDAANEVDASVATAANFAAVWQDASDEGVLWKVITTEPDNVSLGVAWMQEGPDGIRSEFNVDLELFQSYADNDIRKGVYFQTSEFSGTDYNHIVKYRGRQTGNANEVDAKAIRYAEVLLNKAEAQSELNDDGGALATLDELRAERYTGFTSLGETGQALKTAIALERRLELAFEGMRFFDLKRQGLPISRSSFGDEFDGAGAPAEFFTLDAGNFRFNMAIGEDEMNANENMVQNPGY